ncbi:MAG TPA: tRNA (adenosine(37)-N6)-threonylcarbamoyltransferase complex transferase subunit TsaD [Ktedonobacteraceae bacterium]|nr:tRNA (adenosine(37)-N6)-threonylcarbamoyltransferase complex transferase subunit TsaD [Ktedonobacteraceae bacterium]
MLVLGIESSCDETGAAIVKDGRYLLSNVVASQIDIHNRYGGVVPEVASRQQLASIIPVIETALEQAECGWEDLDAIGATYGPGLAGSLLVGLTVGKTLAMAYNVPFLGVNHLEAHIYANWLRQLDDTNTQPDDDAGEFLADDPTFPLLCLVISGAHSELVLVRSHGHYELLGRTKDDAAGEAFDKVARVLGLDYPGGPSIQKAAQQAVEELQQAGKPLSLANSTYRLPRAWLRGTYDFSFSGLKTAVLHLAEGATANQRVPTTSEAKGGKKQVSKYTSMGLSAQKGGLNVPLLAASFQEAVVDVLAVKTRLAAQEYHVKQVLLAGGVAANVALRSRLERELRPLNIRLNYPAVAFCTDNAAMIASAAFFHLMHGERHGLDLDVQPGLSLPFRQKE